MADDVQAGLGEQRVQGIKHRRGGDHVADPVELHDQDPIDLAIVQTPKWQAALKCN